MGNSSSISDSDYLVTDMETTVSEDLHELATINYFMFWRFLLTIINY